MTSYRIRYEGPEESVVTDHTEHVRFPTRGAAAAWALRFLDARLVDVEAELTDVEPTALIEEVLP